MAPKKARKPVQETVVEEPTQDLDVPPETIREGEQKGSEDEGEQKGSEDEGECEPWIIAQQIVKL